MEEAPSRLVKAIKEGIHLVGRNHFRKESEVPIGGEDFDIHADLLQVIIELTKMCLYELLDQSAVLYVPRETLHVNVAHLIVLNQGHEKPESDFFTTVEEKSTYNEVHSLNVAYLSVVLGESL